MVLLKIEVMLDRKADGNLNIHNLVFFYLNHAVSDSLHHSV